MNLDFSKITNTKNILAFSAGVDSSALFFLLLNAKIPFDIVIVNYNVRDQSKDEVQYAKDLAKKYNKRIFIKNVVLQSSSNFEKTARDIRYSFFEDIIEKESYDILITAHQLNDLFEWFLMQLSKGSGLVELLGMQAFEKKEKYTIFRPLLSVTKEELEDFLKQNSIKYFIDSSNTDEKYKRNYFRKKFSNQFLSEFANGVKNSFAYLNNDLKSLNIKFEPLFEKFELEVFENLNDDNLNIRIIDKSLKKRGILLSQKERTEILFQKHITFSHKVNISISENFIYIAPKTDVVLEKDFKEFCRIKKIPQNIRGYIFSKNISLVFIK